MEVNWDQQLFVSSKSFKISSLVINMKKKTYTGLEQHEGE